jgi:uncharacterized protein
MVSIPDHSNPHQRKSLKKHHPYGFQDFFEGDPEQGTIVDWHGSRNVLVTEDFIIGLMEGLEGLGDGSATLLMYSIGCEWGQRDAQVFEQRFEQEFDRDVRQTNLLFLLETWWWPFTSQGWGRWEVDIADRQQGFLSINIFDSVVARTMGTVGKPVCFLYAGLFAGFFTELTKRQLSCIEIQCHSMGAAHCTFLLGAPDRISAAASWLRQGATAEEILQRLRREEIPR